MDKIELIKQAIEKADRMESKLDTIVLHVPSFTSLKIRHLLNNLGAISRNYLECGVHKGGHFCSVVFRNDIVNAVGIDNYSEFNQGGETKKECLDNIMRFAPAHLHFDLIEKDCFQVKDEFPEDYFDLYNYDAQHTESSQQRAVYHFIEEMKNEYIMVVDDWVFNGVEQGTRNGIKLANLKVLGEWVMLTPQGEPENDHWHNGYAVFYLQKQ